MKTINLGILVFSSLAVSVLAEGDLRQMIQLDTARSIAFRNTIEKVPPISGVSSIQQARMRYLYDVVVIENGVETILETIEIRKVEGLESGVDEWFALLAASSLTPDQIVYVFSTKSKFYANTAERAADGRFHKVSGELVAKGLSWERAKFKTEGGVVRLHIEGDSRGPKVFERRASGSFVLKSE